MFTSDTLIKAKEVLIKSKELLSVNTNICFKHLARNSIGQEVSPTANNATQWCSFGAISKYSCAGYYMKNEAECKTRNAADNYINIAAKKLINKEAGALNDENPELIVDMFIEAIQNIEKDINETVGN